jgi:signal transduction histidine kinase/CheY-like chemotaxis protein
MWQRVSQNLFSRPDKIGLDNFLVLAICFFFFVMSMLGTVINLILNLGLIPVLSTLITSAIFGPVYLHSRLTGRYLLSKYIIIIVSIILLNIQWFINFGSYGPILYLFVMIESFIIIFFVKLEKIIFTIIVFIDVSLLILVEYYYPGLIGNYSNPGSRLLDVYSGIVIDLLACILLLNIALKFYISQKEKAMQSDVLKSAFLANMSHEIRTPMNGIMGFAQLLKEPNLTGAEQQEYIKIIEKSGERMLSIINDIIDISKIESGLMHIDMRETNVNDQIKDIHTFFLPEAESRGLNLTFRNFLPARSARIMTDPDKLYAVLMNLVKNAIKYTDKGSIELGYIKISNDGDSYLEFYVRDTGIGISEDRQEAIFQRFVQGDIYDVHAYQGAGLGLAISRAYIEMLKGRIWVHSKPGTGTTFFFTLPYNHDLPEVTNISLHSDTINQNHDLSNIIVLIAEDDSSSEMLLSRELKKYCRKVLSVNNGIKAVETCRNNAEIDVILMDIKMPLMDGFDATKEIRKFNTDVVIIAQTAFAMSGDIEKCLQAGCDDYLTKPINNKSLMEIIKKQIESRKKKLV